MRGSGNQEPGYARLRRRGAAGLHAALASLDGILKKVDGIIDSVQVGKGTIGKLLADETLYNRALEITTQVEKLAETLNSDQGTLGKLMLDQALYDDVRGTIATGQHAHGRACSKARALPASC